ncbi:MarR family transcriptional regulator [Paroceanicella profunda]|uniref:MarR family transcriptional regulator n=1 Tax=Paroceanicella profunda TaxID=2579971 RepID=A0A5B8FX83_9RHOB|nr:MarR family transcriptional regulator [Paroceanicella profunda]QDL91810.1 MarR family transcriptional regulator [Paroceanicella profunda]
MSMPYQGPGDGSAATGDRLLWLLKSAGPQTISDLGAALGMTAAGAQQHLARLEALGLVRAEARPRGRGRPRKFWHLTERGHGRFPDRHADLTLGLIEAAREAFGDAGLDTLISRREAATRATYAAALAPETALSGRLAALAAARSREGYMAEWRDEGAAGLLFIENHCPICAAARACQGLCRAELATFRALLGPEVSVEREDHILAGARRCAYRVRPRD